jgi:hypothetical protein
MACSLLTFVIDEYQDKHVQVVLNTSCGSRLEVVFLRHKTCLYGLLLLFPTELYGGLELLILSQEEQP